MFPIYQFFIPNNDQYKNQDKLDLAILIATNARSATKEFLESHLSSFDPIVHDNSCQIRALNIIYLAKNEEIQKEAIELKNRAQMAAKLLQNFKNKEPRGTQGGDFEKVMREFQSLQASKEMGTLLLAYFLTIGKIFQVNRDGSEIARIDYQKLRDKLSSKRCNPELLKKIVDCAQVKLAENSVSFIQQESESLDPIAHAADVDLIKSQLSPNQVKMISPPNPRESLRPCTFSFYNLKTILLRAKEKGIYLCLKNHRIDKEEPFSIFYRAQDRRSNFSALSTEEVNKLDPQSPLFVIEGLLPQGVETEESFRQHVDHISLQELALTNIAQVPQYSSEDLNHNDGDPRAVKELEYYRSKAQQLGCQPTQLRAFTIVHTHAGIVHEERR